MTGDRAGYVRLPAPQETDMAQTQDQYTVGQPKGLPGQLGDLDHQYVRSLKNTTGDTVPFGVAVAPGVEDRTFSRLQSEEAVVAGIVAHSHDFDRARVSGDDAGVPDQDVANILARGTVIVRVEQNVTPLNPVYVRFAGEGQAGAFRRDDDDGNAKLLLGGRFLSSADADGLAELYFDAQAEWTGTSVLNQIEEDDES